jgi:hypothetical protein
MEAIKKWHLAVEKRDVSILDEILADDVVFHSPVVWTPQHGKEITKMYLFAAMHIIGGKDFSYSKEIVSKNQACLEFTTKIDDIIVNGVDIITFNAEGKIIEFKVMVRPIKGMMILKDKMFELMQNMSS